MVHVQVPFGSAFLSAALKLTAVPRATTAVMSNDVNVFCVRIFLICLLFPKTAHDTRLSGNQSPRQTLDRKRALQNGCLTTGSFEAERIE
jgi:hypothetical protein